MFVNLFERHDRSRFEVSAFSFGPDDGGTMRGRLQRAFDHFVDVRDRRASEVAQLIRDQEIDILVDLVGFTAGNRAGVLAWRPAPVQVNFQGFGLGAPFIDYVFSDAETTPDRLLPFYREKVVRLPETWVSTDADQTIAEATPSRVEEGLPEQGFVFCSFNTTYKITPAIFDVWMHLLRSVEGSVLWLRQDNDFATANLRREAEARGVAPGVVLIPVKVVGKAPNPPRLMQLETRAELQPEAPGLTDRVARGFAAGTKAGHDAENYFDGSASGNRATASSAATVKTIG